MSGTPIPAASGESAIPFRAINSAGLPDLLKSCGISLLVSTYQAGKLMAVREAEGAIWTLLRAFDRPMGLAVKNIQQFALCTRFQIWDFRNAPRIARQMEPAGSHDACFMPRLSFVTGDILGHEMAWVGDQLCIVNTLFSCLCTLNPDFSFVPGWRPPFITALATEDRCHLNGLAVVNGRPQYVTALGETDTLEGWRPNKADGGILIHVPSGQVICRNLSMPHSPRYANGRLWVLEGGTGRLLTIDLADGKATTVAELPGFARGLAFFGPYAFVGLSRIRESAWFGGLPVASRMADLQCGIWVIDWRTGHTVQFMRFEAGVDEIFAIEILTDARFPEVLGFQEERIHSVYVTPPA